MNDNEIKSRALLLRPWYGLTYAEQEEASAQAMALGMAAARDRLIASERPAAVKAPTRLRAARLYLRLAEAPRGFRPADWADDHRVFDFLFGWWIFQALYLKKLHDRGDIVW